MPVRPSRTRSPRSLVIGVLGLVIGIALVLALFVLAIPSLTEQNRIEVRLGDDVFVAGNATDLAEAIANDGPLLLADVVTFGLHAGVSDRDVYLQHTGTDPNAGWLVFDARRGGTGRECTLTWADGAFTDPCDNSTVDASGTGLRAYEVSVDDEGKVVVDLVMRPEPTTTIIRSGG